MKMTNKLLILIFLITNICFAQNWIKTEITDFASINFPGGSELTENPIENLYTYQDEYAFYMVGVRKLNAQQSSLITEQEIPNFYRGVVKGTMNAANGTVVKMNDIVVQEIPALELEYTVISDSNLPAHRFKRILYTNQTMISIEFWPLTEQERILNEKKTEYFNSFTLNANKIDRTSAKNDILKDAGKENDIVYKSGYAIGYFIGIIISISIIIAVIVGLILFIKHVLKKKKKENISNTEAKIMTKTLTIICDKCNTENNYESKYCNRCGYELKK